MPVSLTWQAIALRLALTLIAGAAIGINRGEGGHAAGMRTTALVALAASISMLQVNALLLLTGKPSDSFVTMDPMRLPLGILSGMGFTSATALALAVLWGLLCADFQGGTYTRYGDADAYYLVHWRGEPMVRQPSHLLAELIADARVSSVRWDV